jgi:DNA polymerase-3 subunit alpha
MAASMSRNLSDIKEITKLMNECKAMKISCLGPDINLSQNKFGVDPDGNVRFGLGAIKGLGEGAVEAIIAEREKNGPFTSILDFVQRVNLNAVKRSGLDCLALSGAFDSFKSEYTREQMVAKTPRGETFTEVLMRYGTSYQQAREEAMNSLFGSFDMVEVSRPVPPPAEAWSDLERLSREKELVGIYLSAHPLDDYAVLLRYKCNMHAENLSDLAPFKDKDVTVGGIVTGVRQGVSKGGAAFGIVSIEDYSGKGELALFKDQWSKWSGYMQEGNMLYITGHVKPHQFIQGKMDLVVNQVEFLVDLARHAVQQLEVTIPSHNVTEEMVFGLMRAVSTDKNAAQFLLRLVDSEGESVTLSPRSSRIRVDRELISFLEEQTGNNLTFSIQ